MPASAIWYGGPFSEAYVATWRKNCMVKKLLKKKSLSQKLGQLPSLQVLWDYASMSRSAETDELSRG